MSTNSTQGPHGLIPLGCLVEVHPPAYGLPPVIGPVLRRARADHLYPCPWQVQVLGRYRVIAPDGTLSPRSYDRVFHIPMVDVTPLSLVHMDRGSVSSRDLVPDGVSHPGGLMSQKPCQSCPWIVSNTGSEIPGGWSPDRIASCAPSRGMSGKAMGCHLHQGGESGPCVGYVLQVGGDSIAVRMGHLRGVIKDPDSYSGDGLELEPDFPALMRKLRIHGGTL